MYIFSCPASHDLAKKTALEYGATFGNVEISKFANSEIRLHINETKVGNHAVVVQSLPNPTETNLVEFCLMCDALHRMGVGEITAVIPWLGYSKQDKVFRPGEPLSVKVIAKILQVAPIKHMITFDLHNLAILGFFEIPVTNLSARTLFVDYFRKNVTPKTVVVAPDAGSIKSSTSFAGELGVPVVYMDKKRDLATGEVKVMGISRPIDAADVIIIDDMIVTGSTLVETAKYLKKQNIKSLAVAATHHLYVPGAQEAVEKSGFDEVVVTDTIAPKIKSDKLKVLTVAGIIATELKNKEE
jgi:ribose-phosphate pyrophosphokinase